MNIERVFLPKFTSEAIILSYIEINPNESHTVFLSALILVISKG